MNPNVASAAAQAIGVIGPPAGPHVAAVLVGLLRHDVLAVRGAVTAALMRVDPPAWARDYLREMAEYEASMAEDWGGNEESEDEESDTETEGEDCDTEESKSEAEEDDRAAGDDRHQDEEEAEQEEDGSDGGQSLGVSESAADLMEAQMHIRAQGPEESDIADSSEKSEEEEEEAQGARNNKPGNIFA